MNQTSGHSGVVPEDFGPENFRWLVPSRLAGTPKPGLNNGFQQDLAALQRVKTALLVTLTHEWTPDPKEMDAYGITSLYEPIADMAPPSLAQADRICHIAARYTAKGQAVVFHCHAGQGRTGTLLAAMLIRAGQTATDAIINTRIKNKNWIESESQIAFLHSYAQHFVNTKAAHASKLRTKGDLEN